MCKRTRRLTCTWMLSCLIAGITHAYGTSTSLDVSDDTSESSTPAYSTAKPSFLFLLMDDVGWADMGYNNGTAHTPNIDKWAKRPGSIIMQDMHSGGTVCSPTRATVLTGRNHFRDCVDHVYGCSDMTECVPEFEFAPSRTFTVGDAVRAAGPEYADGAIFLGKWHLGSFYNDSEAYGGITSSPITHGFDHMNATVEVTPTASANCQCRPEWETSCHFGHYHHMVHCNPTAEKCCFNYWWNDARAPHGVTNLTWPSPQDDASYLADSFARFLRRRRRRRTPRRKKRHGGPPPPFAAQISFHNCHIPFIGLNATKEACKRGASCRLPIQEDEPYSDGELDYYACLIQLDHAVGQVLQALEEEGYYDNTLVMLASDNGPEKNCPPLGICQRAHDRPHRPVEGPGSAGILRGRKRDIYEGGHRVPGVVSWPARVVGTNVVDHDASNTDGGGVDGGGSVSWETVMTNDFLPTIMDALGVERPPEQRSWALDGRSILPILQGKKWEDTPEGVRSFGIGYLNPELLVAHGWGYRHGKWKFVEGSASCHEDECKQPQLFDLETDVGERHDVSQEFPKILAAMQEKFKRWHTSVKNSRQYESKCTRPRELELPLSIQKMEEKGLLLYADVDDEVISAML